MYNYTCYIDLTVTDSGMNAVQWNKHFSVTGNINRFQLLAEVSIFNIVSVVDKDLHVSLPHRKLRSILINSFYQLLRQSKWTVFWTNWTQLDRYKVDSLVFSYFTYLCSLVILTTLFSIVYSFGMSKLTPLRIMNQAHH